MDLSNTREDISKAPYKTLADKVLSQSSNALQPFTLNLIKIEEKENQVQTSLSGISFNQQGQKSIIGASKVTARKKTKFVSCYLP